MKGIGRGATLEEQLAEAQRRAQQAGNPFGGRFGGSSDASAAQAEVDRLQGQIDMRNLQAATDAQEASLRESGKAIADILPQYDAFNAKQNDLSNVLVKANSHLRDLQAAIDGIGEGGAERKRLGELLIDLENTQKVAAGASAALAALRTPQQEALDQLDIASQVAGLPAYQRGAQQAYLTTLDQDSRSTDPVVRAQAEAHAQAEKTRVLMEQTQAIRDQNAQLQVTHDLALSVADAWSKGTSAGQEADAARQAALDHLQSGVDATTRKMQILREANDNALISASKTLADLRQQNSGAELTADAAFQGRDAEHQARLMQQIADRTKEARAALENTTDPKQAQALRDAIAGIADETIRWDEATQRQALGEAIQGQREQLDLLQKQIDLIGVGNDQRDIELAKAQALIDLTHMHKSALDDEGRAYLDNAINIAKANDELKRQQAIADELPNFLSDGFDRVSNAITQARIQTGSWGAAFKQLGDIALGMLSELQNEIIKLAFINPAKNFINGDNALPTFSDLIGKGLDWLNGLSGSGGYHGTGAPSPALGRADGGLIIGPGGPRSDKIPVMASNGEFYVNAASTAKYLPLLQAINADRLPHFVDGGFVGSDSWRSAETPAPVAWMDKNRTGANDNGPPVQVNVNNYGDQQATVNTRKGANNQQIIDIVIGAVTKDMAQGGRLAQATAQRYGLNAVPGMQRA